MDWYDYGARMYDNQIGRWNVIDPYGKDWEMSSSTDKKRNTVITFTFTASVLNESEKDFTSDEMDQIATNIKVNMQKIFKGSDQGVIFKTVAKVRSIKSINELKKNEHLIRISKTLQSISDIFGKEVFISAATATNLLKSKNPHNTTFHEIGHTAGLLHPDWDALKNTTDVVFGESLQRWQDETGQSNPKDANGERHFNSIWTAQNLMSSTTIDYSEKQLNIVQLRAMELALKLQMLNMNNIDGKVNLQ